MTVLSKAAKRNNSFAMSTWIILVILIEYHFKEDVVLYNIKWKVVNLNVFVTKHLKLLCTQDQNCKRTK